MFNAKILQINGSSATVEPLAGEDILRLADKIYFCTSSLDDIGITVGDTVSITYTGTIKETYPAQIDVKHWSIFEKSEPAQIGGSRVSAVDSFEALFYRTDLLSYVDAEYPVIIKINSVKDLNDYFVNNKDSYQIDQGCYGESNMADDVFLNSGKYKESLFIDHFLLFIIIQEGSGSVRHRIGSVSLETDPVSVEITRIVPFIGTADMAQWHIVLVLDKSLSETDFAVIFSEEHLPDK